MTLPTPELPPPIMTEMPTVSDEWLIAQATASIRAYCGWHVAPVVEETIVVDSKPGRRILVKSKRILRLDAVTIDGRDVTTSVRWSEDGILEGPRWPDRYRGVTVALVHGYAPEETPLPGLINDLVARAKALPVGLISQSAGPFSMSFGARSTGDGSALVPMLGSEQAALDPYRLIWGP